MSESERERARSRNVVKMAEKMRENETTGKRGEDGVRREGRWSVKNVGWEVKEKSETNWS